MQKPNTTVLDIVTRASAMASAIRHPLFDAEIARARAAEEEAVRDIVASARVAIQQASDMARTLLNQSPLAPNWRAASAAHHVGVDLAQPVDPTPRITGKRNPHGRTKPAGRDRNRSAKARVLAKVGQ